METGTVTVLGATGALGTNIVRTLLARGVRVRAIVRSTSNCAQLESMGVKDFVVADLTDPQSLQRALTTEPRAEALIASAAAFSAHSRRTKGNDARADIEGYRNLVDAARSTELPRFILISILECDKATGVPHFHQKFVTEKYLADKRQPFLALRAAAFLDRSRDVVAEQLKKGVFPDVAPGVAMDMIYSPDLARYAVQAALDLPAAVLDQSVDICCDAPATGPSVAAAFTRALGRAVTAKPVFPPLLTVAMPLIARLVPSLRDGIHVLSWIRKGGYISHDRQTQKQLFGEPPTIEDSVTRYCRDRGLLNSNPL